MSKQKIVLSEFKTLFIFAIVVLILVNQYLIMDIGKTLGLDQFKIFKAEAKVKLSGDLAKDATSIILIKGVPEIYGQELGLQYIDPADVKQMDQMIAIMGQYDPTYGSKKILLDGDLKQRYTQIGLSISCEFCCSAKSIVFENGEAACGCAHSQAMRGLAAYLLKYHGDEYTNDEILMELARWKGLYFPKQMIKKLVEQAQSGNFTPDISALLLKVDKEKLLKNAVSGDVPLPSEIEDLPGMAGGC